MAFAGLVYRVHAGCDEQIAEIFSPANFKRANSPVLLGTDGRIAGYLVSTALFHRHDRMARVIQHHGGTVDDVARHMSTQDGVHEAERALSPYLAAERDTETPEGFVRHFRRSLMTAVATPSADRPVQGLLAWSHALRAGAEPEAIQACAALPRAGVTLREPGAAIVAAPRFVKDDLLVCTVQYEGDVQAVRRHLAALGDPPGLEPELAPYRLEDRAARLAPPGERLAAAAMRCISRLSLADARRGSAGVSGVR